MVPMLDLDEHKYLTVLSVSGDSFRLVAIEIVTGWLNLNFIPMPPI